MTQAAAPAMTIVVRIPLLNVLNRLDGKWYDEVRGAVNSHRCYLRRRRPPRFRGTLAPARRASLNPMAIACARLVTFLPERPDRSVPRFRSCIARSTLCEAFRPYFAMQPPPRPE